MENLLNGLKVVQGEIKTNVVSETFSLELSGTFTMQRGNFKIDLSYYGRMYETKHENVIDVDDWEIQDQTNIMIGDLPIDNLGKLKTQLIESGLSTLANSIGFTKDEENNALFEVIQNHKCFKKMYGKDAKLWRLFSIDEQMLLELKYVCNNFETCGNHLKELVSAFYDINKGFNDAGEEIKIIPFKEVFKIKLTELTE
jgi:hypothetical protein